MGAPPFHQRRKVRTAFERDERPVEARDCNHDTRKSSGYFGTLMTYMCPCGIVYLMHAQEGGESPVEAVRTLTDRAPPGSIDGLVYDMACSLSSSFYLRNPHMALLM